MEYTVVIHRNCEGFWCGAKHFTDNTVGEDYAFAVCPSAVEWKLIDDGEDQENIVFDGD